METHTEEDRQTDLQRNRQRQMDGDKKRRETDIHTYRERSQTDRVYVSRHTDARLDTCTHRRNNKERTKT